MLNFISIGPCWKFDLLTHIFWPFGVKGHNFWRGYLGDAYAWVTWPYHVICKSSSIFGENDFLTSVTSNDPGYFFYSITFVEGGMLIHMYESCDCATLFVEEDVFWRKKSIFDPCDLEWPLTGSRVIGHLRARSLVIVTEYDQNWLRHFGTTLDYVVDRKKERKN